MTIGLIHRNDYVGAGNTATYTYAFPIVNETDLRVTVRDLSGVETLLAWPADYTVTGVGLANGGYVTLTAGSLASGYALTIRRVVDLVQDTDLRNQSSFFAEVHEAAFDRLVMIDQQQQDQLDRTLHIPETVLGVDMELPTPEANHVLAWNADGDKLVNLPVGDALPTGSQSIAGNVDVSGDLTVGGVNLGDALTTISGSGGAGVVGFLQTGTGAVERTLESKVREGMISVADFGAHADGVDCHVAVQAAFDAAAVAGAKGVNFPEGTRIGSPGNFYNFGSSGITITRPELKVTASKYTIIKKTGAGAWFNITGAGYGLEFENLFLVGDKSAGQYGFHFTGPGAGAGVLGPYIHDCWAESVGSDTITDETAGGFVFSECDMTAVHLENNTVDLGGYLWRHDPGVGFSGACDNSLVKHNGHYYSKSIAIQIVHGTASAGMEISQNNLSANGGALYVFDGPYLSFFGNEVLAGDDGNPQTVPKRVYETAIPVLTEDAAGISCPVVFHSSHHPKVYANTVVVGTGLDPADYCMYFSNYQGPGKVFDNSVVGGDIADIRVSPQAMTYVDNESLLFATTLYSDPVHPGIIHCNYDGTNTKGWSFGTAKGTAPLEVAGPVLPPDAGYSHFKVSNQIDPDEWIGMGWHDAITRGYLQAYKVGVGYMPIQFRGPSIFSGADGNTSLIVRIGASQFNSPLTFTDNADIERARIGTDYSSQWSYVSAKGTGVNGALGNLRLATALFVPAAGAAQVALVIDAGSIILGVTIRVTTAITGPATFDIGDGTDVDRWGAAIATALGTTTDLRNATATALAIAPGAVNITLTPNGGNFSGTGAIRVSVAFLDLTAAAS